MQPEGQPTPDSVHRNIGRLSISTEDDGARQLFLASLKSNQNQIKDEVAIEAIEDSPIESTQVKKARGNVVFDKDDDHATPLISIASDVSNSSGNDQQLHDDLLEGESKKKRAKRRRSSVAQVPIARKKKMLSEPTFSIGPKFQKLNVGDLQDIVMSALTSHKSNHSNYSITDAASIEKVCLVVINGLEPSNFSTSGVQGNMKLENSDIPFFKDNFESILDFSHPGTNTGVYDFGMTFNKIRLSSREKSRLEKSFKRAGADGKDAIVITDLLLKAPAMISDEYADLIHPDTPGATEAMVSNKPGYVNTVKFDHDGSHIFALDCEMCVAESGRVLTRVSIIDFNEKVVLDELVKPSEPIIDYVTKYSGITEEMLKDVTTTLEDIQQKILKIISSEDILIGHSLECDLKVLKMRHPRIVDTADIYDHVRGPPAKASLKSLMKLHFDKDIQSNEAGHDSIEDSKSCMDLVKLKITKGLMFGKCPEQYIFEKVQTMNKHYLVDGKKANKTSIVLDSRKRFERPDLASHESCISQEDAVDKTIENMDDHELIVTYLRDDKFRVEEVENQIGESEDTNVTTTTTTTTTTRQYIPYTEEEIKENHLKLSKRLQEIYDELPTHSMMIVCSAPGDCREIHALQKQKRAFNKEYSDNNGVIPAESQVAPWTVVDETKLTSSIAEIRKGVCFIKIKEE